MNFKYIYIISCLITITSCYREIDLSKYHKSPTLVLNARAVADSAVMVSVSRTWYSTEQNPEITISNADVYLYVNEKLLEKLEWSDTWNGKKYYKSQYHPVEGDYVKIIAETKEYGNASATEYIPKKSEISHIAVSYRIYENNSHMIIDGSGNVSYASVLDYTYKITFKDDPTVRNYYFLQFEYTAESLGRGDIDYSRDPVFLAQDNELDVIFGWEGLDNFSYRVFSDELFNGQEYTITLGEEIVQYNNNNSPELHRKVILNSIPESYYKYLYSVAVLRSEGVIKTLADLGLAEPVRIHSNIEGGTGILATSSSSSYEIHEFFDEE